MDSIKGCTIRIMIKEGEIFTGMVDHAGGGMWDWTIWDNRPDNKDDWPPSSDCTYDSIIGAVAGLESAIDKLAGRWIEDGHSVQIENDFEDLILEEDYNDDE